MIYRFKIISFRMKQTEKLPYFYISLTKFQWFGVGTLKLFNEV